ncbi:MAG: exosome complex RNA-binding protein Csl4 [Candidatus Bathyarchaeota archaeon]|nr:exosome complex RNA-binding protein Csl4 [Candidatus Bathyarchaeota archaeon]MDH5532393.1 exosome complex RNA-binding protein Csl4 [Candidatus Bathyarchaeota archaeon]
MTDSARKSGQFVAPGDRLGVIEEFTLGPGTYEEEGTIYSEVTGRTLMDMLNKKISVFPLVHAVGVPKVGSTVTGQVSDVQSRSATLRIIKIGKKSISGSFTGILHISDVSPGFVESMFDVCKAGDIMRARVVSDKNRVLHLSTADKNLGVVYALCSRCGQMLPLKGLRMRCTSCGKIERRKIASDYGEGEI